MIDPLFWLGLSILLVAVSLTAVLVAALPALQELARAARSAEKLFDTLSRELPPTLEAIRFTGREITSLTDDVSQNIQSAGRVVEQLDQTMTGVKQQTRQAQVTARSVFAGFKAAWQTFNRPAHMPAPSSESPASASQLAAIEAADGEPMPGKSTESTSDTPFEPQLNPQLKPKEYW